MSDKLNLYFLFGDLLCGLCILSLFYYLLIILESYIIILYNKKDTDVSYEYLEQSGKIFLLIFIDI